MVCLQPQCRLNDRGSQLCFLGDLYSFSSEYHNIGVQTKKWRGRIPRPVISFVGGLLKMSGLQTADFSL